jgi:hypothetical protein
MEWGSGSSPNRNMPNPCMSATEEKTTPRLTWRGIMPSPCMSYVQCNATWKDKLDCPYHTHQTNPGGQCQPTHARSCLLVFLRIQLPNSFHIGHLPKICVLIMSKPPKFLGLQTAPHLTMWYLNSSEAPLQKSLALTLSILLWIPLGRR